MNIEIPKKMKEKLLEDSSRHLNAAVQEFTTHISEWLSACDRMIFFPDFTDHGINHIQSVLDISDFLIADGTDQRPNSWDQITAADISTLIFSVCLHDVGMHLTPQAFLNVINFNETWPRIDGFKDKPWRELWESFISDCHRLDGRSRRRLFGDALDKKETDRPEVRRPSANPKDWDDLDKRLIGEFIRKFHARLSHEVALFGWPDHNAFKCQIPLADEWSRIPDVAGLVARSHSMSINETFEYLKDKHFTIQETGYKNTALHPVYLMSILRVADFLNLHASRAPGGVKELIKRKSPISKLEFASHQAIDSIRLDTDPDPEAVAIDVELSKLKDVITYFRIKSWLEGLQSELDHSWAILGQVYGRHQRLQQLWLQVRRVTSNLLDNNLGSKTAFIPERAFFGSSNSDFLNLLITPLYGDRPEIGIRELLQNAVDAVREIREYLTQTLGDWKLTNLPILDDLYPDADVIVNVCSRDGAQDQHESVPADWEYWVEVKDRGIGMTIDVIRNYFLKAGATFRNNDLWKKQFVDEEGRSKILKSGRFGVGVLAAYLLGDIVQVTTKFISDEKGIKFQAKLDDDLIELKRFDRTHGTSILVRCSKNTYENLTMYRGFQWDWYYLSDPKVIRLHNSKPVYDENYKKFIPAEKSHLPPEWRRLNCPEFSDIHWTYQKYDDLFCNGIEIRMDKKAISLLCKEGAWSCNRRYLSYSTNNVGKIKMPCVSVFDPDRNLNLTLARDGITTNSYPFNEKLVDSIIVDLIAHSLVFGPEQILKGSSLSKQRQLTYSGLTLSAGRISSTQWIYLKDGFTLADPYLAQLVGVNKIVALISRYKARWLPSFDIDEKSALIGFSHDVKIEENWPFTYSLNTLDFNSQENPIALLNYIGYRILVPKKFMTEFEKNAKEAKYLNYSPELIQTTAKGKCFLVEFGKVPPVEQSFFLKLVDRLSILKNSTKFGFVCEAYLGGVKNSLVPGMIAKRWLEVFERPYIPYEKEARMKLFKRAYSLLYENIAAWEKIEQQNINKNSQSQNSGGSYPNFKKATEIKKYLKDNGIKRKVFAGKVLPYYSDEDKDTFIVSIKYSFEEIKQIYPEVPDKGNPFSGISIDKKLLPDYTRVLELLAGSNASVGQIIVPKNYGVSDDEE